MSNLTAKTISDLNILVFGAEPEVAAAAMNELHGRALAEDIRREVEVVASAQIHGGTRVIVLTAREPHPGHFVVVATAYDSNHPGEDMLCSQRSGSDLAELVDAAREDEPRNLESEPDGEFCNCWTKWDPHCGRPGCWGVDTNR